MNAVADMISAAYADMDPSSGMFPSDWRCRKCDRVLNADGNHPAELYAGTYTGMCYRCSNGPKYVEGTRLVDGGTVWNYPPHCPSWRRDRETFVFYWDCPDCKGLGSPYHTWERTARCERCSKRSYTYGPGHDHTEFRRRAYNAAQARFERRLAAYLKLPKRTSKKRRNEAFLALKEAEPAVFATIADQTLAEWDRVNKAIGARAERMGTYKVFTPTEVMAALAAVLRFH